MISFHYCCQLSCSRSLRYLCFAATTPRRGFQTAQSKEGWKPHLSTPSLMLVCSCHPSLFCSLKTPSGSCSWMPLRDCGWFSTSNFWLLGRIQGPLEAQYCNFKKVFKLREILGVPMGIEHGGVYALHRVISYEASAHSNRKDWRRK